MSMENWEFNALDTLFFRESRPMESIGGSQLQSVFPPPARTLIGAIRTAVGEALDTDWHAYREEGHPLRARIGTPESLGPLGFTGPFLQEKGQRLYPLPLAVLFAGSRQTRLLPGAKPIVCDLGRVALPIKADPELAGAAPRENAFVTAAGLQAFLEGRQIPASEIRERSDLFSTEERLGIARDNRTRVTGDGLLYQTSHIRPHHDRDLGVGIVVRGLDTNGLPQDGAIRLGAEGRLAAWRRNQTQSLPEPATPKQKQGLILALQTAALFTNGWLPDGFTVSEINGQTVWRGALNGIALTLVCGIVGKPVREGGWDMVNHCPRPLQNLVPAGSCYFCTIEGDLSSALQALHGQQIGQETEFGRGEIAVGYW